MNALDLIEEGKSILSYDDVENIMVLTKACHHLVEPNESITERDLPQGFQYSYVRNGFRVEILVTETVAYDTIGDNFIRRFVLVMLDTMLAPVSQNYVPMSYYEFSLERLDK
jgi:hypothetical protein